MMEMSISTMSPAEKNLDLTAAEWAGLADRFLLPEDAIDLRRKVGNMIRERAERARQEAERLEREFAALSDGLKGSEFKSRDAEEENEYPNYSSMSVDKLVLCFAGNNPGAGANEFATFVAEHRGDTFANNVHASLYKLSKDGRLRKQGEKPHTKYYPVD